LPGKEMARGLLAEESVAGFSRRVVEERESDQARSEEASSASRRDRSREANQIREQQDAAERASVGHRSQRISSGRVRAAQKIARQLEIDYRMSSDQFSRTAFTFAVN